MEQKKEQKEQKEKEPITVEQQIMTIPVNMDRDETEYALSMVNRRTVLLQKMMEVALSATYPSDWVDQDGSPWLMGVGAERMARRIALLIWDARTERIQMEDDRGHYYYFVTTGKVGFSQREFIEARGTCSSRDPFWSKRGDKWLPVEEVDVTNIDKSSYTNFLVNGVMRFFGLRGMTWEDLEKYGIKPGSKVVTFKKDIKEKAWTPDQKKRALVIAEWLMAKCENVVEKANAELEQMTTFKGRDGKQVAGKKSLKNCSGAQIDGIWKHYQKEIETFQEATKPKEEKKAGAPVEGKK
jgi:hypothetical protein